MLVRSRTEVETPYVLKTHTPNTASHDDHHVLHKICGIIPTWGRPFAPIDGDLFPFHLIERAAGLESPDVVQRLQPIPPPNTQISFRYSTVACARRGDGTSEVVRVECD